jgi:uncharacterized protein YjbI with pentapeptide repeats
MITTQPIVMAVTLRASTKGLKIIDEARRKKGWAKSSEIWAGLALTSIPTLKRFWAGMAIQTETFRKICAVVGIEDLESIVDAKLTDESPHKISSKRLSFAIAGSIDNIEKHKLDVIVALLQKLGGDTSIEILDIDEGSIQLILGGSPEGLDRIEALFKSGELSAISDILVQDVHFLRRMELIRLIRKNGGAAQNLGWLDLSEAELIRTDLRRADLSGSILRRAYLIEANLSRADLSRADLSGAILKGADLSGVDLSGANLSRTILSRADLNEADLSGANLSRAYLRRTDLSRADLSRADLSGAILSGAILNEADLSGAILSGAKFSNNPGLSEVAKAYMEEQGAIFEDSPESDVPSFV